MIFIRVSINFLPSWNRRWFRRYAERERGREREKEIERERYLPAQIKPHEAWSQILIPERAKILLLFATVAYLLFANRARRIDVRNEHAGTSRGERSRDSSAKDELPPVYYRSSRSCVYCQTNCNSLTNTKDRFPLLSSPALTAARFIYFTVYALPLAALTTSVCRSLWDLLIISNAGNLPPVRAINLPFLTEPIYARYPTKISTQITVKRTLYPSLSLSLLWNLRFIQDLLTQQNYSI